MESILAPLLEAGVLHSSSTVQVQTVGGGGVKVEEHLMHKAVKELNARFREGLDPLIQASSPQQSQSQSQSREQNDVALRQFLSLYFRMFHSKLLHHHEIEVNYEPDAAERNGGLAEFIELFGNLVVHSDVSPILCQFMQKIFGFNLWLHDPAPPAPAPPPPPPPSGGATPSDLQDRFQFQYSSLPSSLITFFLQKQYWILKFLVEENETQDDTVEGTAQSEGENDRKRLEMILEIDRTLLSQLQKHQQSGMQSHKKKKKKSKKNADASEIELENVLADLYPRLVQFLIVYLTHDQQSHSSDSRFVYRLLNSAVFLVLSTRLTSRFAKPFLLQLQIIEQNPKESEPNIESHGGSIGAWDAFLEFYFCAIPNPPNLTQQQQQQSNESSSVPSSSAQPKLKTKSVYEYIRSYLHGSDSSPDQRGNASAWDEEFFELLHGRESSSTSSTIIVDYPSGMEMPVSFVHYYFCKNPPPNVASSSHLRSYASKTPSTPSTTSGGGLTNEGGGFFEIFPNETSLHLQHETLRSTATTNSSSSESSSNTAVPTDIEQILQSRTGLMLYLPRMDVSQYLNWFDFLLRNFHLYRLDSCNGSGIRQEILIELNHLRPYFDARRGLRLEFGGWSRMACPIYFANQSSSMSRYQQHIEHEKSGRSSDAAVVESAEVEAVAASISAASSGEQQGNYLEIDIGIDLSLYQIRVGGPSEDSDQNQRRYKQGKLRSVIRQEWLDQVRKNDPIFLIRLSRATAGNASPVRIEKIRTAVVVSSVLKESSTQQERDLLIIKVRLMNPLRSSASPGDETSWDVLLRRQPQQNNWLAVLDTIRDLLFSSSSSSSLSSSVLAASGSSASMLASTAGLLVPDFLRQSFLGIEDPRSISSSSSAMLPFKRATTPENWVDYARLFSISSERPAAPQQEERLVALIRDAFASGNPDSASVQVEVLPAQKISIFERFFSDFAGTSGVKIGYEVRQTSDEKVEVRPYEMIWTNPIEEIPGTSSVRHLEKDETMMSAWTTAQLKAIINGTRDGLSLVIGPPGTGKTDVAVSIIRNIIRNFIRVGAPAAWHRHRHRRHRLDTAGSKEEKGKTAEAEKRILIVTKSNHALNDIFEKICATKEIDDTYLLRLGHGEEDISEAISGEFGEFSKKGRIDRILAKRLILLDRVSEVAHQTLAAEASSLSDSFSLGAMSIFATAPVESCEMAGHLFEARIKPAWTKFLTKYQSTFPVSSSRDKFSREQVVEFLRTEYPFFNIPVAILSALPTTSAQGTSQMAMGGTLPTFGARLDSLTTDDITESGFSGGVVPFLLELASQHFEDEISPLFDEVAELRPFEILTTPHERGTYLVAHYSRVVAMTCTHAVLKRRELLQLGFNFDTVLMEESAQMLEIETFIPLVLNTPQFSVLSHDSSSSSSSSGESSSKPLQLVRKNRLRRVILIGDHHQLPPVVQNVSLQRFAHFDQSTFTRLVARLGTQPQVLLDAQGRMRSSLADLYRWLYDGVGVQLRDMAHVKALPEFQRANAGFSYEFQLVDVGDWQGRGETEPHPFFHQNLAEAEFVVATYMYMRLLGYPREKIVLLTTYNGQRHLLRDVVRQRCAPNPLFGWPAKISTVDRFQGQQSEYVLLSLVRTKAVGHLRDVRRLIVAMSRAQLGLYVFCRLSLFENVPELSPVFSRLKADNRPDKLTLMQKENFPSLRDFTDRGSEKVEVRDLVHMGNIVQEMAHARMRDEYAKLAVMNGAHQEPAEQQVQEDEYEAAIAAEQEELTAASATMEVAPEQPTEEAKPMEVDVPTQEPPMKDTADVTTVEITEEVAKVEEEDEKEEEEPQTASRRGRKSKKKRDVQEDVEKEEQDKQQPQKKARRGKAKKN